MTLIQMNGESKKMGADNVAEPEKKVVPVDSKEPNPKPETVRQVI